VRRLQTLCEYPEWHGDCGPAGAGRGRAPSGFGQLERASAEPVISYPLSVMSKRPLSPALLPHPKRLQGPEDHAHSQTHSLPSLSDELILCIFSHLSSVDLCTAQATVRNWSRLATDNELWRKIYLRTFGRSRLRGGKGFVSRADGREVKPLPTRAVGDEIKDWKWMYRISSNWRKGKLFAR